ncbi:MAG: hypothetical protein H0X03_08795 [Nitrosopumilus sp.]|nr:hypothetical protein [Nitrosopumilus sp.]
MNAIESTNNKRFKKTLKYLIVSLLFSAVCTSLIILLPNEHIRHSITIITLNVAAASATILGIIAVYRYRMIGSHGKSYLFLTLGITLWFCADLNLLYSYFIDGIEEQKQVSLSDILWLSGYVFLSLHLIFVIRTIRISNISKTITILLIFIIGFIIINLIHSTSFDLFLDNVERDAIEKEFGIINLIITLIYPILDLGLIIPSIIILVNLYHDYQHSLPWVLASLSLLFNAIGDNGYVNDFIRGSTSLWVWDLLYINDFIIMSAAFYWYNKFHISDILKENKNKDKNNKEI